MKNTYKLLSLPVALIAAACASSGGATPSDGAAQAAQPAAQAPANPAPAAAEPTTAAPAGLFTNRQADRGRDVFRGSCTECHYSSEFNDAQFKFKWRRRSAGDLFEHISTTMPEDAPGSLDMQQYADLVAYILRMNGFEPGSSELPPDAARLGEISLASISN